MICDKKECTGCFACYNICPKKAIEMIEDDNGFIYPRINKEKCIDCNLCRKVCPSLNKATFNSPKVCYAMQAKDSEKLKESTSGGASTIFAEYILKNDGVIYGAAFEEGFKIQYVRIENIKDLRKIKGSKYVHCYVNDTYKKVKEDLNNKRLVLFTGTPCQIAGLKRYLMKDYENLYCIDIICHGVPSQSYLKDEISSQVLLDNIDEIKFRDDEKFKLILKSKGEIVLEKNMSDSKYYEGFMEAIFYRDNCYQCLYARPERISDITIGDFWGISHEANLYKKREHGLSVLLILTEKGMKLLDECAEEMELEERPVSEAVNGNSQLRAPSQKYKYYEKFKKLYPKYGFGKAYVKTRKMKMVKKKLKTNLLINYIYRKMKRK